MKGNHTYLFGYNNGVVFLIWLCFAHRRKHTIVYASFYSLSSGIEGGIEESGVLNQPRVSDNGFERGELS